MEIQKTFADFYLCITNAYNSIVAVDDNYQWYCAKTENDGSLFTVNLYQKDKYKYTYDFDKIVDDLRKIFDMCRIIDVEIWEKFRMTPTDEYNNRYFSIGRYEIY